MEESLNHYCPGHRNTALYSPGARLFDGFEVLEVLGAGSCGTVYRCADLGAARQHVAVKVIKACNEARFQILKARMAREARAMNLLQSPHVVKFIELCRNESEVGIVQEYVEGTSLAAHIRAKPDYTWVIDILLQIAQGLKALHNSGILHRDIKPSNVLIDNMQVVKLADLGVALLATDRAEECERSRAFDGFVGLEKRITAINAIVGTPLYMPPEYILDGKYDERSELYCFSVLSYELCHGGCPFEELSLMGMLHSKVTAEPLSLSVAAPECPKQLAKIIMKGLQIDPAERYQSIHELLADLQNVRSQVPNKTHWTSLSSAEQAILPGERVSHALPARERLYQLSIIGVSLTLVALLVLVCGVLALDRFSPRLEKPVITAGRSPSVVNEQQSLATVGVTRLAQRSHSAESPITPTALEDIDLGHGVGWSGIPMDGPAGDIGLVEARRLSVAGEHLRLPVTVTFDSECGGVDQMYIRRDVLMSARPKQLVLSLESLNASSPAAIADARVLPLKSFDRDFSTLFSIPRGAADQELGLFLCSVFEGDNQRCHDKQPQDFARTSVVERRLAEEQHFRSAKLYYANYFLLVGGRMFYPSAALHGLDSAEQRRELASTAGFNLNSEPRFFEGLAGLNAKLNSRHAAFDGSILTIHIAKRMKTFCF